MKRVKSCEVFKKMSSLHKKIVIAMMLLAGAAPGEQAHEMPPTKAYSIGNLQQEIHRGASPEILPEISPFGADDVSEHVRSKVLRLIQEYKSYYTENPEGIADFRARYAAAQEFIPLIRENSQTYNVPLEIALGVFMQEAIRSDAISPKGARGFYQLMPETARSYGLRVGKHIDERVIPKSAIQAGIHHLAYLKEKSSSWPDALAAYNMGETRLRNLKRRYGANTFWGLAFEVGRVPEETRKYVPKVYATAETLRTSP